MTRFANVERCLARFPGEIIDGINVWNGVNYIGAQWLQKDKDRADYQKLIVRVETWLAKHPAVKVEASYIFDDAENAWEDDDYWTLGCESLDDLFDRLFANIERYLAANPGKVIDDDAADDLVDNAVHWIEAVCDGARLEWKDVSFSQLLDEAVTRPKLRDWAHELWCRWSRLDENTRQALDAVMKLGKPIA